MFVTTFYSYKGGVGRTMALVNTALSLAQAGKRVLAVDFDLEAPSLPNYDGFCAGAFDRGLVDYIKSYRETGVAQDVSNYIYKCDQDGYDIWLMPAGNHHADGYADDLASIDWQDLYDNQMGFLFFEDLRQQWGQFEGKGFDYVLIDSRTGYTDVGGICTRQLPDCVVVMFVPNPQNIHGLRPVIDGIRGHSAIRNDPVRLVFCASNVPDLDDEQEILSNNLSDARGKLKYKQDELCVVHHYNSLSLLSHAAFVRIRPNSRLSKEYKQLARMISAHNIEDVDGARGSLNRLQKEVEEARSRRDADVRDEQKSLVDKIRRYHPLDGQISYKAARLYHDLGDTLSEVDSLTAAIEAGYEVTRARLNRARCYQTLKMQGESVKDLFAIIADTSAGAYEVAPVMQILDVIGEDWNAALGSILERSTVSLDVLMAISPYAQSDRRHLGRYISLLRGKVLKGELSDFERSQARNTLILSLIGFGMFSDAANLILADYPDSEVSDISDAFNLFMACWGRDGSPNLQLAEDVVNLVAERPSIADPNFSQCLALVHLVLGDKGRAIDELNGAINIAQGSSRIFDCFNYLTKSAIDFRNVCEQAVKTVSLGEPFVPWIVRREVLH